VKKSNSKNQPVVKKGTGSRHLITEGYKPKVQNYQVKDLNLDALKTEVLAQSYQVNEKPFIKKPPKSSKPGSQAIFTQLNFQPKKRQVHLDLTPKKSAVSFSQIVIATKSPSIQQTSAKTEQTSLIG